MKNLTLFFVTILLLVVLGLTAGPQAVYGKATTPSNPPGQIRFQQSSDSIDENATAVEIVIERIDGNEGEVVVGADTFDGTATAGQDYPATAETVVFADGETEKTISIPIIDNNTMEPDETFLVSLNIIAGSATITEPSTITITILDNDTEPPAILHFASEAQAVLENALVITVTVRRSGGTSDPVQVSYETANGTATAGSDYMPAVGTLSFNAGETVQTFTVLLLDDPGAEGSETFTISLNNVVGVAALGKPSLTAVTIIDNETSLALFLPTLEH